REGDAVGELAQERFIEEIVFGAAEREAGDAAVHAHLDKFELLWGAPLGSRQVLLRLNRLSHVPPSWEIAAGMCLIAAILRTKINANTARVHGLAQRMDPCAKGWPLERCGLCIAAMLHGILRTSNAFLR